MNRTPRIFVAALLSAALFITAAPVAQARTLAKPRPVSQVTAGSWLDAAILWFGSFFTGSPAQTAQGTRKLAPSVPTSPSGGGIFSPTTGACIDPNGCTLGGGGSGGY
jgi:hypothetical protein